MTRDPGALPPRLEINSGNAGAGQEQRIPVSDMGVLLEQEQELIVAPSSQCCILTRAPWNNFGRAEAWRAPEGMIEIQRGRVSCSLIVARSITVQLAARCSVSLTALTGSGF